MPALHPAAAAAPLAPPPGPPAGGPPLVRERVARFGAHGTLVGVATLPPDDAAAAGRPRRAVVMANVGLGHHVGPFRLWVELARAAAADGWHALRFDLSGLGDSAPAAGGAGTSGAGTSSAQAEADVTAALDWLEATFGVREVVVVGLCSGVDSMHPVAVADSRVVGAVFVDGYTYPTPGFRLRRRTLRYLQAGRWRRHLDGRYRTDATPAAAPADTDAPQPVFEREYPSLARFRADVAAITGRGARALFVFTGTVDAAFNSPRQLGETLGRSAGRPRVDVAVFRQADHLFTGVADRAAFFARVRAWLATVPAAGARGG